MLVEPVHSIQLQQTHFVSYGNFPKAWFPWSAYFSWYLFKI